MATPIGQHSLMSGQGLRAISDYSVPRKIKINRILIKAEVRKCFAGTDWEAQNLDTICTRVSDKLGVYGDVDEDVIAKVQQQVRDKLKEKGRDPDAAPPAKPEINLYGGDVIKDNDGEVNLYANDIMTFPPPPPPRVFSPQDAIAQASVPEVESDSDPDENIYGLPKSPVSAPAPEQQTFQRVGYDWSLEKLKRTIQMQFAGATSWRTVITAVVSEDTDFSTKIAEELYGRISAESKPFSHEEIGNMALSSLDKMYIRLNENKKRIPVTKNVEVSQLEGQVAQGSGDQDQLVNRLRAENQKLRADLDRERQEKRVYLGELDKLRGTLSTVEANNKQLADMLQSKQRELSDGKRLVSEMSSANVKVNDESMAVRAQMEEIRQFAIRSQKVAQQHAQGVAHSSVVQPMPKQQVSQVSQPEGRPSVAPVKQMLPVKAISSAPSAERIDSTIPEELKLLHFPYPRKVEPWQSTTSYAKTKNGTTKAIVTWTIVDFRNSRHVITLEHNHYTFRGKSKRKVFLDNVVQISEKTDRMAYQLRLEKDEVTVTMFKGENGFQYHLKVNDLSFEDQCKHYVEIQAALRQSMVAEKRG